MMKSDGVLTFTAGKTEQTERERDQRGTHNQNKRPGNLL